ncbi:MAG: type 1 glutamine amidotransferase domain-containing protein [Acidimicrobiales bacterium]
MATVLLPIPDMDFDPTEVAVSWQVLTQSGHSIVFATANGSPGSADDIMITGVGLDPWGWIPGLRRADLFGRFLRADSSARADYARMTTSEEFLHPRRWSDLNIGAYDALLLPGGHRARGMRRYLESEVLQALVIDAFNADKPVAAVCHGVLLAARSVDPATGKSVLYGRKTTSLTWHLESMASGLGRFIRFWDPNYYRTYPDQKGQPHGYMSVQSEVTRSLATMSDFIDVGTADPDARIKNDGRHRDTADNSRPAHVVEDGRYVSARWPGDVHTFAKRFGTLLDEQYSDATKAESVPTQAERTSPSPTDLR